MKRNKNWLFFIPITVFFLFLGLFLLLFLKFHFEWSLSLSVTSGFGGVSSAILAWFTKVSTYKYADKAKELNEKTQDILNKIMEKINDIDGKVNNLLDAKIYKQTKSLEISNLNNLEELKNKKLIDLENDFPDLYILKQEEDFKNKYNKVNEKKNKYKNSVWNQLKSKKIKKK